MRLFAAQLLQFVRDGAAGVKPTHLAIIFDKSEKLVPQGAVSRLQGQPLRTAGRSDPQFPLMREAVRAFGLTHRAGCYEADDLIATYAVQAVAAGADVLIVSADKD